MRRILAVTGSGAKEDMNKAFYGRSAMVALGLGVAVAQADVRLPKVFSDHMVLQRDIAAPVWGWADPGETVTVRVADQTVTATADQAGNWRVKLSPLKAGGPFELVVAGKTTHTVRDVLVGDVWICAGQSNMEFGLGGADNGKEAMAAATNTQIRLLTVKPKQAIAPAADIPNDWQLCSPQSVSGFSAVGYFFGQRIHQETGVPIGLIGNAWGGTAIEPWMNFEGTATIPELAPLRRHYDQKVADYQAQLEKGVDTVGQWVEQARAAQAKGEPVSMPPFLLWTPHPAALQTVFTSIYNSRVAPLVPFGIKGAIWYQGEANGGEGDSYYHKMQGLVGGWRKVWDQGDFPFYFVQLANYQASTQDPAGGDGWANVRMAQLKSLQIPHTGMAVAIDIGAAGDIHPRNKDGKSDLVCSGPLYKSMTVEGGKIRISFDYAGGGLMAGKKTGHGPAVEEKDGTLKRVAIAGEDKKWFWANAVIDGPSLIVSSESVPAPVAVRYAFSMNPADCNLYNKEGLPASPFRTDNW
jgi:sialate O-acetylesterase